MEFRNIRKWDLEMMADRIITHIPGYVAGYLRATKRVSIVQNNPTNKKAHTDNKSGLLKATEVAATNYKMYDS